MILGKFTQQFRFSVLLFKKKKQSSFLTEGVVRITMPWVGDLGLFLEGKPTKLEQGELKREMSVETSGVERG